MKTPLYLIAILTVASVLFGCSKDDDGEVEKVSLQTFHLDPRDVIHRINFDSTGNWATQFLYMVGNNCSSNQVKGVPVSKIEGGKLWLQPRIENLTGSETVFGTQAYFEITDPALKIINGGLKGGIGIEIGYDKFDAVENTANSFTNSTQLQVITNQSTATTSMMGENWDPRTDGKIHLFFVNNVMYRPFFDPDLNDWRTLGCDGVQCDNGYNVTTSFGLPPGHLMFTISSFISQPNFVNRECRAHDAIIDYIEIYRLK